MRSDLQPPVGPGRLARLRRSPVLRSLTRSPIAMVSAFVAMAIALCALFAPLVAPQQPFEPAQVFLIDSYIPPVFAEGGDPRYLLGTDNQGRDVLSTILYGARISLLVGISAVAFSMILGVVIGILAGYFGGALDAFLMRVADVQLTLPSLLIALTISGVMRSMLPQAMIEDIAIYIVVFAIGINDWPQYARIVRGSTMVEKSREYVAAAELIGVPTRRVLLRHILPNAMGPVLVVSTISLALAIITEATLSFLGAGMPPTTPSLGTLIRIGNDFLFSGEWWITLFPSLVLIMLALSVNLLGDWLRDALNPKLR